MRTWMSRCSAAALGSLLVVSAVRAQDGPAAEAPSAAQLDGLLGQLAKTGSAAWDARVEALRAASAAATAEAEAKRKAAAASEAQAKVEADAAKAVDAEIGRLDALRELLSSLKFRDPAGQGETAAAPQGQLELALAKLGGLPAEVWQARTKAMQEHSAARVAAAKAKTDEAAALTQASKEHDARAAMLTAEIDKLGKLREMVAGLKIDLLATAAPKPPAEAPAAMAEASAAPAAAMVAEAAPAPAAPAAMPAEAAPAATKVEPEGDLLTYDDHLFPIFEEYCVTCHDAVDAEGGLDLSTHAAALQGGGSGTTLRPGNPDASRLYLLVSHKEKPTMPPDEPRIAAEKIEAIRKWIAQGAPKDMARAKALAVERAEAKAKAAAEAAARAATSGEVQVVMPDAVPPLAKAYPERPGAMRAIAASPGAPLLAVPGFGQVLLVHAEDLREIGVLPFPYGPVEVLTFAADGATLLAAGGTPGREGGAVLYDVKTGAERGRFGEQRDAVLAAGVSAHGELVAVGGTRRRVEVFRVSDGRALWQGAHDEWVTALALSPDGELLASGDRAGKLVVREAANGREVHVLTGHEGGVSALAFRPDSGLLASAGADRTVRAHAMKDGREAWKQSVHGDAVLCLAWRTDDRLLSGGADGRVLHWKVDGGREPELPRLGEWVYGVAAPPADAVADRAYAVDWSGRLAVFDIATRKVIAERVPLAIVE